MTSAHLPAKCDEPRPCLTAERRRCEEHGFLATLSQGRYEKALKAAIHIS